MGLVFPLLPPVVCLKKGPFSSSVVSSVDAYQTMTESFEEVVSNFDEPLG